MVIPSPINTIALIFTIISQPHLQKPAHFIMLSKILKISNDSTQQTALSVGHCHQEDAAHTSKQLQYRTMCRSIDCLSYLT